MTGLYRHECSNCGNIKITDDFELDACSECDDKYAAMILKPAPEHDRNIMEPPEDDFECPDCGSSLFALATETGKDWMCRQSGGCGFAGWRTENEDIRPPESLGTDESARRNAWSRYQRHQRGHFNYR